MVRNTYQNHDSTLNRYYSTKERYLKLEQGFNIIYQNRPHFYHKYELTTKAHAFFKKLSESLINPSLIQINGEEQNKFIQNLIHELEKFNIKATDANRIQEDLKRLLNPLIEFDQKKRTLEEARDQAKSAYVSITSTLLEPVDHQMPWYVNLMYKALKKKSSVELLGLLKAYGADFNRSEDHCRTLLNTAIYYLPSFNDISRPMRGICQSIEGCEDHVSANSLTNSYNRLVEDQKNSLDKELRLFHYLLGNGANPQLGDENGDTPLFTLIKDKDLSLLSKNDYEAILMKLIEKGADINAICNNHSTSLHVAAHLGDTVAVEFLLKHGANADSLNGAGNTPLHLAAKSCFPTLSELLIDAGANVSVLNKDGFTPLQLLENSYAKKRKKLTDQYHDAEKEKSNHQAYGFFGSVSFEEIRKFHDYFRGKIDNLDNHYRETKSNLKSEKSNLQCKVNF